MMGGKSYGRILLLLRWKISSILSGGQEQSNMAYITLLQKAFLGAAGNPLKGRFGQPPLPNHLYKSCICRGGSQAAPTNQFVGAAGVASHPYKSICRGGCSTSHPYKYMFVGAVQSRTAPTVCFPAKKFKFTIQNRVAERPTTNVLNRVRVAERPATNVSNRVRVAERPATSVRIAERPATNVPNRVHVAERPATATTSTRVFYKLQLQVQFTRIYTIHH